MVFRILEYSKFKSVATEFGVWNLNVDTGWLWWAKDCSLQGGLLQLEDP